MIIKSTVNPITIILIILFFLLSKLGLDQIKGSIKGPLIKKPNTKDVFV
jgi:hypothetical protein